MYSTLANAYYMAVADNGNPEHWALSDRASLLKIFEPYLNVTERCYDKRGCVSDGDFNSLNGTKRFGRISQIIDYPKLRLNGGFSIVVFDPPHNGCEYDTTITDSSGNSVPLHVQNDCGSISGVINNTKDPNASTYYRDGSIGVYDSLIKYTQDENELAGVLAHEISHAIDYRQGILRGYFSFLNAFSSKNYEYKADKRAVDFMVKANYNPIGLIVALNRIAPEYRYDVFSTHPLTSRRTATIYEYIYTKYPEYLVQNEYKDNMIYQNFLITSKENRKRLEEKIKSNSTKKVKYL